MYKDRFDAAEKLSKLLSKYKNAKNTVVLAIPRGGLEIGYVLAKNLNLPLDIIVVKKLGHPNNEEYAIGAVGKDEVSINEIALLTGSISPEYIKSEEKRLRSEVQERYSTYQGGKYAGSLKNKTVIICDDGIATGLTLSLCIEIIKKEKPKKIIVAVPVGPPDNIEKIRGIVNEVYCPIIPEVFSAIGAFYESFYQVKDKDAIELLKKANRH